jgi:hypothetical protein
MIGAKFRVSHRIMHQQLWWCKVEEKLYLGVCEKERLNAAAQG